MKLELLEARQFFADFFYGEHHLPSLIKPWGEGWMVTMMQEIATTDYNEMTRLVLMAHARGIRVSIKAHSFKYLKLILHKRDVLSTELSFAHPTLEQAIERHTEFMEKKAPIYKVRPESEQFVLWKPKVKKQK